MAYLTAAEFRQYTGISSNLDDSLITALIARAQQAVDVYTARTFEAAADTTKKFDAELDVRNHQLLLDWTPYGIDLCQITSVVNGDGMALLPAQYVLEPRHYAPWYGIRIRTSTGLYWDTDANADPEDAIAVTGRWAYSITPPPDIVHATLRMAVYMYRQKDSNVFDVTAVPGAGVIEVPQGFPRDVERLLSSYRRRI